MSNADGLLGHLKDKPYTVVIIMAGTNDLAYRHSADDILRNVQQLHSACHARGLRTVALPIPPSEHTVPPRQIQILASEREKFNEALERWARSMGDKVLFVDTNEAIPFSTRSGDWCSDGLHMTAQGYEKFGNYLSNAAASFILNGRKDNVRSLDRSPEVVHRIYSPASSVERRSHFVFTSPTKAPLLAPLLAPELPLATMPPQGSHVLYRRSNGEQVIGTVVGPSAAGSAHLVLRYTVDGVLIRNPEAVLAQTTPIMTRHRLIQYDNASA